MKSPSSTAAASMIIALASLLHVLSSARPSTAFLVTPSRTRLNNNRQHTTHQSLTSRFASVNANKDDDDDDKDNNNTNPFTKLYQTINKTLGRDDKHFLESSTFVVTPLAAGLASFWLYPQTSLWFHTTVNYLSKNTWEPVDGGQLQWSILLPALNGVVMTAISLLYANLISTTGTQLRNRQIMVHSSLSQEVEGLRGLVQLVPYYPPASKAEFANFIQGYLHVLMAEIDPHQQRLETLRSHSGPLSDYRDGLHALSVKDDDDDATTTTTTTTTPSSINGNILERSYETLQQIGTARNARITSLQTKFPNLHYVTITALTVAILLIFLLETDRKVILFLEKFQIR